MYEGREEGDEKDDVRYLTHFCEAAGRIRHGYKYAKVTRRGVSELVELLFADADES